MTSNRLGKKSEQKCLDMHMSFARELLLAFSIHGKDITAIYEDERA